jgi:hypothetical protein
MGIVGLVCGFFGSFWLAADPGNAAPLIGIFITGPLGVAVGLAVGAAVGLAKLRISAALSVFGLAALCIAASALAITSPEYVPHSRLVEATVKSCAPVSKLLMDRTAHWRSETQRVADQHLETVRPSWQEEVPLMVEYRPGVVLTLNIQRKAWYEERAWRWGRRDRRISSWEPQTESERVFADASLSTCDVDFLSVSSRYLLCYERWDDFPPTELPGYLGLWVIHEVPLAKSDQELLEWASHECPLTIKAT